MFTKLPAWRNAPLSDAKPVNQKAGKDGSKNAHAEKGPESNSKPPQFPLLVFSHGLGGTRTMYSSVCGEVSVAYEVMYMQDTHECSLQATDSLYAPLSIEMAPGHEPM